MNSLFKFPISLIRRSFKIRFFHQKRSYCQVSKICWSCSATLSNSEEIFCSSCKVIQKIPKVVSTSANINVNIFQFSSFQDFFDLFGLPKLHNLDLNDLTTKFRHFQSQIHPDKFSGKTAEEQTLSSEWSSLINKAYKILQSPLARGEYLLRLKDVTLPEDNSIAEPELLLEMMEKNEEVSAGYLSNVL